MTTPDLQFRAQLRSQSGLADACKLLAAHGGQLGWERMAFQPDLEQTRLPRDENGENAVVAMGWPADYVRRWEDAQRLLTCPLARRSARSMESFMWDCDPDGEAWRGDELTEAQRATLETYREYVDAAVTVPVHRPGGKTGYVSWFGRNRGWVKRRHRELYRELHLISHAFIAHTDALESAERRRRARVGARTLSARELECLSWAALGKTDEDIARILGRSRDTVHFHLSNTLRKLNAANRTNAVAIACSLGLVRLF